MRGAGQVIWKVLLKSRAQVYNAQRDGASQPRKRLSSERRPRVGEVGEKPEPAHAAAGTQSNAAAGQRPGASSTAPRHATSRSTPRDTRGRTENTCAHAAGTRTPTAARLSTAKPRKHRAPPPTRTDRSSAVCNLRASVIQRWKAALTHAMTRITRGTVTLSEGRPQTLRAHSKELSSVGERPEAGGTQ